MCHFHYDSDFQPNTSLTLKELVFQSNFSNTFGSEQNQGTNSHKDSQPSAMLVNSENQDPNSTTWIPDSGASFHVTGESENIQQLGPFKGPNQIYIGNGQGLSIKSSGYTKFVSPINPRVSLSLKQLLHVPAITKNLISVNKFSKENNIFFELYPNHCVVKSQGTNEVLLQGSLGPDGLYMFPHLALCLSHLLTFKFQC